MPGDMSAADASSEAPDHSGGTAANTTNKQPPSLTGGLAASPARTSPPPNDVAAEAELRQLSAQLAAVDAQLVQLQARRRQLADRQTQLRTRLTETRSARLAAGDWDSRQFPWTPRLEAALRDHFGISSGFRPQQRAAINASLSGHDVLLVMPTGGGKSLCYQLPAVADGAGVTLVVSPLVSLMEDQVMALRRRGVTAELLSANISRQEATRLLSAMTDTEAEMRLLYVTPEKMARSKRFMTKLQAMHKLRRLSRLAIDEVHCCSQWGHDFRPDYKFLGVLKTMFPDVPIMGLTATCTGDVARDVKKMLHIPDAIVFKASFNRPNLFYRVCEKPPSGAGCVEQLCDLLSGRYRNQSGIIYTTSTRETEQLAAKLSAAGVAAAPYHAQLPAETRSSAHRRWLDGQLQVVVATIAFGMGIDKPDVRFVIHHSLPKSLENYYQESGRAGRDGAAADCLLMFRLQDVFSLSSMVFTDAATGLHNLYSMVAYCISAGRCRRALIAQHFEERWTWSDCARQCDACQDGTASRRADVTRHARALSAVLQRAADAGQRLTAARLLDAWLGRGAAALRPPNQPPPGISQSRAEAMLAHLLIENYLKEDFHFTPYRTISYIVPGPNDGVYPVYMDVADAATTAVRTCQQHSGETPATERAGRKRPGSGERRSNGADRKPAVGVGGGVPASASTGEPAAAGRRQPRRKRRTQQTSGCDGESDQHRHPGITADSDSDCVPLD